MADKYTLLEVAAEEMALFYSARTPGRDQETGCIGHMRQDFGRNGKEFHTSWDDHCPELKTQAFKDEFDEVINHLRDEGIFKSRDAMQSRCRNSPQTKLSDGREYNHGFRIKTDNHVYYLRCTTLSNDYSYVYAYERSRLEKCFPSLVETALTDELKSKLEKVAAFIVEKSANSTISGNYFTSADDIPADLLSPELFAQHIGVIAEMMDEYGAVAEVDVTPNGEIDVLLYLDYCPNFEPLPDEEGDFPLDRKILDPLATRQVKDNPALIGVSTDIKERPNQKVYKNDIRYARANGEVKLFEESAIINHRCALAIDEAIRQNHAIGSRNFSDAASAAILEYGADRVKCVLANTINNNYDAVDYTDESKEWASQIKERTAGGVFSYLHADVDLVDGFIKATSKHFSDMEKYKPNKRDANTKPSLAARLEKNKQKAAAQVPSAACKSKELEV